MLIFNKYYNMLTDISGGGEKSPAYLMTLEEYQKTVVPVLAEYNKFIKKNFDYLASTDYNGIFYYTFPELLSDVKNGTQKGFMFRRGEYDKGYSDEEFARRAFGYRKTGKFDKEYEPAKTPEGLTEKKNEYINKLRNYFTEEEIVRLIEKDEFKSNKRTIKRAIDDDTYKKLLNEGKVTVEQIENVAASVGVKLPKKIFSESLKKSMESQALYEKIYASMPSVNKQVLSKMVDDIKETFKPLEKIIYERETKRYEKSILETLEQKEADVHKLHDWLHFFDFVFKYEKKEERKHKEKDRYNRDITVTTHWIVGLSLNDGWKDAVSKAVLEEIEMLKVNMIYSIIDNFQKITMPIESIEQVSLDVGAKGFEGTYKFKFKNGSSFIFKTEAIGAGGYNIQRYHFRYLTHFTDITLSDGTKVSNRMSIVEHFSDKEVSEKMFNPYFVVKKAETIEQIIDVFYNYLKGNYKYSSVRKSASKTDATVSYKINNTQRTKYFFLKRSDSLEENKKRAYSLLKELEVPKPESFDSETLEHGGGVSSFKSNLTEEQQKLVRTPEFKSWFGDWELLKRAKEIYKTDVKGIYKGVFDIDVEEALFTVSVQMHSSVKNMTNGFSQEILDIAEALYPNTKLGDEFYPVVSKVVDSNGEPLVVYHGFLSYSKKDWFYEFNRLPAFFSTRRAFAEQYAQTKSMDAGLDKDANTYECFLNIKKLFDPKDKNVVELARKKLPEKIKVSHGTMWFLDADLDKDYVVDEMAGIQTIYPDRMTDTILKINVGDVFDEPVSMSQYEKRILLYKDEDWAYTVDLDYFNEKTEKEVAEYVSRGDSYSRKSIKYKDKYFEPYVVDKTTFRMKLNDEPIAVEFRNDLEKYRKNLIENITTLKRVEEDDTHFEIPLKDYEKLKGYWGGTISIKKRNLKSYKVKANNNWTMFENETVQKFLLENGFGGWIAFEKGDKTYAVYEAQNIKLADGTNKTFDINNKDIRFDKGGQLTNEEKDDIYSRWKNLINMSYSELEKFYNSEEGREAGLSNKEANKLGIDSGRESARWIMKMKNTNKSEWTPLMWKWAKKQISFVSRMKGNKGGLYDEKGEKTRKHTSLLIWGHNPNKKSDGGSVSNGKINVLYLHGLDATPETDHVSILKSDQVNIISPYFDYNRGREYIFDFISNEIIKQENIQGIIGHSFGGFLAYYLSNKHNIPCLMFNPAFDKRNEYTIPNDVRKLKPYSNQIAVVGSKDSDISAKVQLSHLDKSITDVYIEEIDHDIPDQIKLKYFEKFIWMLNNNKKSGGAIDSKDNLGYDEKTGKEFWFEYHCFESCSSADAEVWYHSHQKVKVLFVSTWGNGDTPQERGENGEPRVYRVKFEDGLEWDVFEDELMDSPEEFYRPDPPKKPIKKVSGGEIEAPVKLKPVVDDFGFYSPIEKRILEFRSDRASVNKWKDIVGIKSDEAKFTGLSDFLNSKKPDETLLKIELLNFIKDNHIELVFVNKSDSNTFLGETYIKQRENGTYALAYRDTDEFVNDDEFDSPQELTDVYENEEIFSGNDVPYKTKYSKYVIKGNARNYTELLVMLPDKAQQNRLFYNKLFNLLSEQVKERMGIVPNTIEWNTFNIYDYKSKLTSDELHQLNYIDSLSNVRHNTFSTVHWDERNILVHLRFDIRKDENENDVLFINELQSDWGQRGKKSGFGGKYDINLLNKELKEAEYEYNKLDFHNLKLSEIWETPEANRVMDIKEKINQEENSIPLAPFVTDTNKWVKLGLKIAIQQAVLNNVKYLSWGAGEQQNELYDLSKSLNKISWWHVGTSENTWGVTAYDKNDKITKKERDVTLSDIEKLLGKDIAEKIKNHEGYTESVGQTMYGELKGDNLKLSGSGMIAFYGSVIKNELGIVGNVLKSLVKELTGKSDAIQTIKIPEGKGIVGNPTIEQLEQAKKLAHDSNDNDSVDFLQEQIDRMKSGKEYSYGLFNSNVPASFFFDKVREPSIYTEYAIEITDELKKSVDEGIPMFKVGGQIKAKNPYSICTVSLGRVIGTQKRSKWTSAQLKKYERCVLNVKKTMKDGGGVSVEDGGQFVVLSKMDNNRYVIYSDKDGYKITVNNPDDAKYIELFYDGKRIGVLEAREHYLNDYHGHTGKFLSIQAAYIDDGHKNKGFGLKMYQALKEFSADDIIGFFSDLENRQNKKVIPKIYSHFNNEIVGDYHIVTYNDGGVVSQTLYFAIYRMEDGNEHWYMVAKHEVNNDEQIETVKKLLDRAVDDNFKVKSITKKEYEDWDLGDEITTDEPTQFFKEGEISGEDYEKKQKGGSLCKCKFRTNRVPSKRINEYLLSLRK